MKNFLFLSSLIAFLTGCSLVNAVNAPKFDSEEYYLATIIKKNAINGFDKCKSSSVDAINIYGKQLQDTAQTYSLYTEHLYNNDYAHKMSVNIQDMITNLIKTNDSENGKISTVYCQEKFENIVTASDKMLIALSTKQRN